MDGIQEEIVVLFHAALLGRTDVIQNALASLRNSGKFSAQDIAKIISQSREEDQATPLHIASQFGHKDVIRALLNAGAELNSRPSKGDFMDKSPYELAIDNTKEVYHVYFFEQIAIGNIDSIQRLLDGGIPVNTKDGSKLEDTALHWACSFGNINVAEVLISNGIDVNLKNSDGQTALHIACKHKHSDMVKLLLDEGANTEEVDMEGRLPKDLSTDEIAALLESKPEPSLALHKEFLQRQHDKEILKMSPQKAAPAEDHHERHVDNQEILFAEEKLTIDSIDDSIQIEGTQRREELLLVFWPPVQHQFRPMNNHPFSMNSSDNLLICMSNSELDLFPILNWSGLMDILDIYGFQAQVKRSAKGAKIRLCIDRNVCPVRESYHIAVHMDQIVLTAADYTGLLYAVYTLIQLLQLHSSIIKQDDGTTTIRIPAINILDRPQLPVRSVLWSYRQYVQFKPNMIREYVELLSKMRINRLSLVIDPSDARVAEHILSEDSVKSTTSNASNASSTNMSKDEILHHSQENIFLLDELCDKHCIELIPTVLISSIHDRLPLQFLKKFSQSMISLVFMFDEAGMKKELLALNAQDYSSSSSSEILIAESIEECIRTCSAVLKETQLAGFTTVQLTSSNWTTMIADPNRMASHLGIHFIEKDFATQFPSSLFSKPFLCSQDYIKSLHKYVTRAEVTCSFDCVFPAFMDRDFHLPTVFVKYYTFMFGGLAWNRSSVIDMLGDPESNTFNTTVIMEVLCLLAFYTRGKVSEQSFRMLLSLLTLDEVTMNKYLNASSTTTSGEVNNSPVHVKLADLAVAEKVLLAMITLVDEHTPCVVPNRAAIGHCLKLYKKIITEANWKAHEFSNKESQVYSFMQFMGIKNVFAPVANTENFSEVTSLDVEIEELYCTANFLSVICRSIMLSIYSYQRQAKIDYHENKMTYQQLTSTLAVGNKSDVANSILEALHSYTFVWKRKFENILFQKLRSKPLFCDQKLENIHHPSTEDLHIVLREMHRRYLFQTEPVIPGYALFRILCAGLPLPKTLEEYVERMFS